MKPYKEKKLKAIKIEEEKSNQRNYVHNQYNKLFTENELSEEKENAKIEYPLNL